MPFDITASLDVVASALEASGELDAGVSVGEPKTPPREGFGAAIFMDSTRVVRVYLGDPAPTEELHVVKVRIYRDFLAEPQADVETELARKVAAISAAVLEDADLNGEVRNVDVAGEHGRPMETQWGHVDVGGTKYRAVDLIVPLIVDGSSLVAK